MEGLLREVIRQELMDRVEPRWKRLEELNAEPRWPRKGRREAWRKDQDLLAHPTKGDRRPMNARKRRLVKLKGSPPRAIRLMAEPEGRQLRQKDRREKAKRTVLTGLDRSTTTQGVSGKRWRRAWCLSRN